jgi:hypothetical protein
LAINLDALLIHLVVNVVLISPILWISGRLLVGKGLAKFTDAFGNCFFGYGYWSGV